MVENRMLTKTCVPPQLSLLLNGISQLPLWLDVAMHLSPDQKRVGTSDMSPYKPGRKPAFPSAYSGDGHFVTVDQ